MDAVVHSAGLVKARDEAEFFAINIEGTRNLLDAAQERRAGAASASSSSPASRPCGPSLDGKPVPATGAEPGHRTTAAPSSPPRSWSSRAAKDSCPVVVLRPPMIYGPRDNESFAFFQSVSRALPARTSATARTP